MKSLSLNEARLWWSFRRSFVLALTGGIFLGHLFCIFARKDKWPFSDYHMYAGMTENCTILKAYGISRDDPSIEVLIPNEGVYEPRSIRILGGLSRLRRATPPRFTDQKSLDDIARQVGILYERQRQRGEANLPPISGLRIYEETWILQQPDTSKKLGWKKEDTRLIAEALSW